jgi:hypothetical protein
MSISEDNWISSQRKVVEEYLGREGVDHLGVGEYPAFHVHPYLAVWAVQSKKAPGWVGWWAISGDLPTDYVSRGRIAHPRQALREFAQRWREVSDYMIRGEAHPDVRIGSPNEWPWLGPLLRERADNLQRYVDEADIWQGELAELDAAPNVGPTASRRVSGSGRGRHRWSFAARHYAMSTKWGGLLFGLGLVAIANIGAFWLGRRFKLGVAVLVASVFIVTWLYVRHRKARLLHDLVDADRETQNAVLAELDEDDRRDKLRRLGRDA